MLASFRRGRDLLTDQRYEERRAVVESDAVALEVSWTGTLDWPLGLLAAGDVMRASFAVFLEVRGGRIVSQRNYDCFEPF